jgi:hypothetical protein
VTTTADPRDEYHLGPNGNPDCDEARQIKAIRQRMSIKQKKPLVYVASPYTKGDPAINTHFQCQIFDELMNEGMVYPYVPLWSHFQHTVFPRDYSDWVEYDLGILHRMDACLRLNATNERLKYEIVESSGADGEVAHCKAIGVPVFYNIPSLYDWARTWRPANE